MKRIYAAVLLAAMCLLLIPSHRAEAVEMSAWAAESVGEAFRHGTVATQIMSRDYTDEITRVEFCNQLMQLHYRLTGERYRNYEFPFSDTYDYDVSAAYGLGIVNGVGDEKFAPRDPVTRQEIAKMMAGLLEVAGMDCSVPEDEVASILSGYPDSEEIAPWARPYVAAMTKSGYLTGTDAGFAPLGRASIEQAIVLSLRIYKDNGGELSALAPAITNLTAEQVLPYGPVTVTWDGGASSERAEIAWLSGESSYINWRETRDGTMTWEEGMLTPGIAYDLVVRVGDHYSTPLRVYYGKRSMDVALHAGGETYKGRGIGLYDTHFAENPALLYTPVTVTWTAQEGAARYEVVFAQSRVGRGEDRTPELPTVWKNLGESTSYTIPMLKPVRYYQLTVYAFTAEGGEINREELEVWTGARFSSSEKYDRVRAERTIEEAAASVISVEVPVWKINSKGEKYESKAYVSVNSALADDVRAIFTEIFNGPEQFPIATIGGYRDNPGEHGWGTAIDINADQNYCIYTSGQVVGSFYKPFESPYSITPDGDVVTAFEKYGWVWGADAWSGNIDYMHFSYTGT